MIGVPELLMLVALLLPLAVIVGVIVLVVYLLRRKPTH